MIRKIFSTGLMFLLAACAPKSPDLGRQTPENNAGKGAIKSDAAKTPNWFTLDAEVDGVPGTSADRAYKLAFAKQNVAPIVVAVIDAGVDVDHEALKKIIWTNQAEANGLPGVDDDNNGYIDDIHGWDFLGSVDKTGAPTFISKETLEVTREAIRMQKLKEADDKLGKVLTAEEQTYFNKVTQEVAAGKKDADASVAKYTKLHDQVMQQIAQVESLKTLTDDQVFYDTVQNAAVKTDAERQVRDQIIKEFDNNRLTRSGNVSGLPRLKLRLASFEVGANYYYNVAFDPRAQVIGDDPSNTADHNYGNAIVRGPLDKDGIASDANHGTHVSGIIGAVAGNSGGIHGVARDVRIMPVRAVPDGDEADKDIANSVRYAVDNGARIISMSFGKPYSPYKNAVDAAFAYAAQKGVLIVHASGNESSDTDVAPTFPNRFILQTSAAIIPTWLDIGASSINYDTDLVASFSNFGQSSVDLFSPGVDITSSVSGNKYDSYSGTSMATPATSGVAALVWSQFPQLTVDQLRTILVSSVVRPPDDFMVKSPADQTKLVPFKTLSSSGGIVNAFRAMLAAQQMVGQTAVQSPKQ